MAASTADRKTARGTSSECLRKGFAKCTDYYRGHKIVLCTYHLAQEQDLEHIWYAEIDADEGTGRALCKSPQEAIQAAKALIDLDEGFAQT